VAEERAGSSQAAATPSTLSRGIAYAAGEFLSRASGLILLPLYTHYLEPGEYGVIAVAKSIAAVLGVALSIGLPVAGTKLFFDFSPAARKTLFGTLYGLSVVLSGLALLLLLGVGPAASGWLVPSVPYSPYLVLALFAGYAQVTLLALPQAHFRVSGRAKSHVSVAGLQVGVGVAATAALVVVAERGAQGALEAHLVSLVVAGLLATALMLGHVTFRFDPAAAKRALSYGPLWLPHLLSHWMLSASDRVVLARYVPVADVGAYSLGYQLGSVVMLVVSAGSSALTPLYGGLDVHDPRAVRRVVDNVAWFIAIVAGVGVLVTNLRGELLALLASPAYASASAVIPWVVAGFVFMALYTPAIFVVNFLLSAARRAAAITLIAALANLALNVVLVPRYGFVAAAVTTTFSYAMMFAGFAVVAHRGRSLPYPRAPIAWALALGVVAGGVGLLVGPTVGWGSTGPRVLASLAFFALLPAHPFFRRLPRLSRAPLARGD
jgi:O-antigen/teichoic acid export membrane protein